MRILFIGNSHTYVNDMCKMVYDNAKESGVECEVTMLAHPGWTLEQHANGPEAKFNILYGNYDYVVLQEHAHPFTEYDKYHDAVIKLNDYIKQTKAKTVISTVWAEQRYPERFANMMEIHRKVAKEINSLIAYVDEAWLKHQEEQPDVSLYGPDGEHASRIGSKLIADTVWETIFKDYNGI